MNFNKIGILEIDGERMGFRTLEVERKSDRFIGIKGELFDIFQASNIIRNDYPSIKKVIFNDPATVVIWSDGTKTVVKCQPGDVYSKELGLAMCISKKYLGNKGNFNEVFKKWIPEDEEPISDDFSNIGKTFYNLGKTLGNILKTTPTIPEMRATIQDYCRGRVCRNCVIHNLPNHTVGHCSKIATDAEIIENYNAIINEHKED